MRDPIHECMLILGGALSYRGFVLAPIEDGYWRDTIGRTILPHVAFGQTIVPGRERGGAGFENHRLAACGAKVWSQSGQNYGSGDTHQLDFIDRKLEKFITGVQTESTSAISPRSRS